MSYLHSYRRLNRLIQDESFEPLISWGVRMALAGTLPVLWGLMTGHMKDAVWITITAEAISWVEMKGSFVWRVRTLLAGAVLSVLCADLGLVTGTNIWWSMISMFVIGFVATLLKSIGDRASGLAICVYMLFIICNAFPATDVADLKWRTELFGIGAALPVVVGLATSLLMPAEEPFRRQIALIWRSVSELAATINHTGSGSHIDVYDKEREVRATMDTSYEFYGKMAHQSRAGDPKQAQLLMLRKLAGLVTVNLTAMAEELEYVPVNQLDQSIRLKAGALFQIMSDAINRISVFVITLKPEERLLAAAHINRLKKFKVLVAQYPLPPDKRQADAMSRIVQLTDRTVKLLESALARVDQMGKDVPVYRSYSFLKSLLLLRPKYLARNVRFLFNFNTLTSRFALRSAIAATFALLVYKYFHIDHGYWLPFSVMIVIQPYFGATLKKAIDRVAGTLLGGLAGGLLLYFPVGLHLKETILFLSFLFMVYYLRKNYAIAAFIITLNLVLLFNIESAYSNLIVIERALCTIGGSLLAVGAGFALLPAWDKKWLPTHLAAAISQNYLYFTETFFATGKIAAWTRLKRQSESRNSDVYDSFNRYMEEPGREKTELFYELITTNIRITRNLNNIHLEHEENKSTYHQSAPQIQQKKINEALARFNDVIGLLQAIDAEWVEVSLFPEFAGITPFELSEAQMISLEKINIELEHMMQDLAELVPVLQ